MSDTTTVSRHYTHGGLLGAILSGLEKLEKGPENVQVTDLAPVDEFHIGGRVATESFLDQIGLRAEDHVLDIGCGLGGASRFAAHRYGCRVTGVDLTQEYVETGTTLCSWVGLAGRVNLEQGNATATPYADGTFDKAFMLHVGMNIADKPILASELHRVIKPGGTLGIYDVMRVGDGELTYPVPWATDDRGSVVGTPAEYEKALKSAGFAITDKRNRRDFALEFFARLQAVNAHAAGPPALGLHILMGETAPEKVRNMIENISDNRVAPVELIAKKPA